MTIIKLFSNLTQFYLILVKPYYNFIIKTEKNFDKNMKYILLKMHDSFKYQKALFIYLFFNILPNLISLTFLISLISASILFLTLLIFVKYYNGHGI